MEHFNLEFEYEESPASNNGIALFISAGFNGVKMKDILDVDEFFNSIEKAGINPLFTCSCGNFGCGGYYVEVVHEESGIVFKNSYDPLAKPDQNSLLEVYEYQISWEDVVFMGRQIYDVLREIIRRWPGYSIFSGTYCTLDLGERIESYEEILMRLEVKLSAAG